MQRREGKERGVAEKRDGGGDWGRERGVDGCREGKRKREGASERGIRRREEEGGGREGRGKGEGEREGA